jgi:hypothetical protein
MRTNNFHNFAHLILSNKPTAYAKEVLIRESGLYFRDVYSSSYALTMEEKDFAINKGVERFIEYVNLPTVTLDSLDTVKSYISKIVSDSYTDALERSFKIRGLSMV